MAELDEKTATEVVDDPVEVRRAKREALLADGPDPYARRFDVTAKAAELEERYADLPDGESTEDVVRVAGRVMAVRNQGKVMFVVIRDATGDLQLFIRINVLGEEGFALAADLDMGDWIGAEGAVVRTRRGQLSVAPTSVTLPTFKDTSVVTAATMPTFKETSVVTAATMPTSKETSVVTAATMPVAKETSVLTGVAAELSAAPEFSGTQSTIVSA